MPLATTNPSILAANIITERAAVGGAWALTRTLPLLRKAGKARFSAIKDLLDKELAAGRQGCIKVLQWG